jgi:hypothetical protein
MIIKLKFVKLKNGKWVQLKKDSALRAHDYIEFKELRIVLSDEYLERDINPFYLIPY